MLVVLMLWCEVVIECVELIECVYEGDVDVDFNLMEVIIGWLWCKIGVMMIEMVCGCGYWLMVDI